MAVATVEQETRATGVVLTLTIEEAVSLFALVNGDTNAVIGDVRFENSSVYNVINPLEDALIEAGAY